MSLLDEISAEFQVGRGDLERFVRAAPIRYRVYEIPKRTGGTRVIAQPSSTLKTLQRFLLEKKLYHLPVHTSATAYEHGKGIVDNAKPHVGRKFLLKLDFQSFFPSLTVGDWQKYIRKTKPEALKLSDINTYSKIMFWGVGGIRPICLSIGAHTSPFLSNALLYEIDTFIWSMASEHALSYTRYADDIALSGDSENSILRVERSIYKYINYLKYPRLSFNNEKRGLYGPGKKKIITGLIVTPDGNISIGRDRKRLISAMIHRATFGELDLIDIQKLRGLLSFCISTEPSAIISYRNKYGQDIIDRIISGRPIEMKRSP